MSDPQFNCYKAILDLAARHQTKKALREAFETMQPKLIINEDEPISGYYRKRRPGGALDPVGIWRDGDQLFVYWGGEPVSELHHVWPSCVWDIVPFDWYDAKLDGKEWPDLHEYTEDDAPLAPQQQDAAPPAAGHNSGASESELEKLRKEIEIAQQGVKRYAIIADDEHAKASQTLRSDLLKLSREAKKIREELDRPHKDAIEKNKVWKKLADEAQECADAIRAAQSAWETKKLEQQRAEQERLTQQQRDQEAQAAEAQAAVDRGEPAPEPMFLAPTQPKPEPLRVAPQTSFRGATGRAAHVARVDVIDWDDITDWKALFLYFVENDEARRFMLNMARATLKRTGEIAPGCNSRTVAKVS